MNLQKIASEMTETKAKDWKLVDGQDSGVGVDYWLQHITGAMFYANCDQGVWAFEVMETA
jgi:hypothetical protein